MLQRFSSSTGSQVDDRKFKFVISDESRDRYGTVIKMDGWNLENYNRNGVVLYQHVSHSWDPDMVVGKGRAWVEDGKLWGEVEFEPEGSNKIADKLVKKIGFGSLNATSVGFASDDYSWGERSANEDPDTLYFRKQDLLEWSLVTIPANPNATIDKALSDFVKELKDGRELPEKETTVRTYNEHRTRLDRLRISLI